MLWAIVCLDGPAAPALRAQHLAAHRAHLMAAEDRLAFGAAMQSDDGSAAIGTLLIVAADSRADAQSLIDADPFARHGVFASITVSSLRKGLVGAALQQKN